MLDRDLDYRIEEEPDGAEHLLVTWPGLRLGGAPPSPTLERLKRFRAHKLSIAADDQVYMGPAGTMRGAMESVAIVRAEAERLGVARENVITYGPSMRAVCALWMGFEAGAGRIIAGASPVRLGQWLRRLSEVTGPAPEAVTDRARFLALAEREGGPPPEEVLDALIPQAAWRTTAPVAVHLFVSEDDPMYPDNVALAAELAPHPTIACDLHVGAYGDHGEIKDAFKRYLVATLREIGVPRRTDGELARAAARGTI